MRLGLLADIHEEVEHLNWAIRTLRDAGVDRFLLLGDLYEHGGRLDEMLDLLEPLGAEGVWGNHDYGLCVDVSEWVRGRFSRRVLEYFGRLKPAIRIGGDIYQHIEPYLDPSDLADIWSYQAEGLLDPARSFGEASFDRAFLGHIHRWAALTPDGPLDWSGERPVVLDPDRRYLIVIHGVQQGYCALFDTDRRELTPFRRDGTGPAGPLR
ncbi:MAG: metallophosphoesterase family protein [Isosphaeraceae bacterium]